MSKKIKIEISNVDSGATALKRHSLMVSPSIEKKTIGEIADMAANLLLSKWKCTPLQKTGKPLKFLIENYNLNK